MTGRTVVRGLAVLMGVLYAVGAGMLLVGIYCGWQRTLAVGGAIALAGVCFGVTMEWVGSAAVRDAAWRASALSRRLILVSLFLCIATEFADDAWPTPLRIAARTGVIVGVGVMLWYVWRCVAAAKNSA